MTTSTTNPVIDTRTNNVTPLFPVYAGYPPVKKEGYRDYTSYLKIVELPFNGKYMLRLTNCLFHALKELGGKYEVFFQRASEFCYIDEAETVGIVNCNTGWTQRDRRQQRMFEEHFTPKCLGIKIKQFLTEKKVYPEGEGWNAKSRFKVDGTITMSATVCDDGMPYGLGYGSSFRNDNATELRDLSTKRCQVVFSVMDLAIMADLFCGADKETMAKYPQDRIERLTRNDSNDMVLMMKKAYEEQIKELRDEIKTAENKISDDYYAKQRVLQQERDEALKKMRDEFNAKIAALNEELNSVLADDNSAEASPSEAAE
jgi:hypothetical protein